MYAKYDFTVCQSMRSNPIEYNTDFQKAGQRSDNAMILKCNELSIRRHAIYRLRIILFLDAHLFSDTSSACLRSGHRVLLLLQYIQAKFE